eukprot:1776231-Lingulodinium_polyedra.AAC.1
MAEASAAVATRASENNAGEQLAEASVRSYMGARRREIGGCLSSFCNVSQAGRGEEWEAEQMHQRCYEPE